ncbi:hypothetical protein QQS21_005640 [Conoideocrella luteorostrata]|uniref:Uncharacterized protein n=1 Tax=Conoideocrella luteorostrata TaxID=1105319 RepID=A0AAJ0CP11_9HYPO|nr:hypothetical protein QQS21_005640 [Conoideocrella luteorostrata]
MTPRDAMVSGASIEQTAIGTEKSNQGAQTSPQKGLCIPSKQHGSALDTDKNVIFHVLEGIDGVVDDYP